MICLWKMIGIIIFCWPRELLKFVNLHWKYADMHAAKSMLENLLLKSIFVKSFDVLTMTMGNKLPVNRVSGPRISCAIIDFPQSVYRTANKQGRPLVAFSASERLVENYAAKNLRWRLKSDGTVVKHSKCGEALRIAASLFFPNFPYYCSTYFNSTSTLSKYCQIIVLSMKIFKVIFFKNLVVLYIEDSGK